MPEDNGTITFAELFGDIVEDNTTTDIPENNEVAETKTEEEIPSGPTFSKTDEEANIAETDDNVYITEEEINELETEVLSVIDELNQQIESVESEKKQIASEMESVKAELEEAIAIKEAELNEALSTMNSIEELWGKIQENEVLASMVKDHLEGKEVNIPKMIEDKIKEDLSLIPEIDTAPKQAEDKKPQTLQDVFNNTPVGIF